MLYKEQTEFYASLKGMKNVPKNLDFPDFALFFNVFFYQHEILCFSITKFQRVILPAF
jgi:hypothetical protein